MAKNIQSLLQGGDLRSVKGVNEVINIVVSKKQFDLLIKALQSNDRLVVMRSADAIEKITGQHPEYLASYKTPLLQLFDTAVNKELKWHLALLAPRLVLEQDEWQKVWNILYAWAADKTESRIVRVNAVQSLFDLLPQQADQLPALEKLISKLNKEGIPSLSARIKMLKKKDVVKTVANGRLFNT